MPNSTPIANVEIQLQDGLQSSIPPVLFRTVPPIAYPSNATVSYSGYSALNAGVTKVIFSTGTQYPFVYLRNAGPRGLILVTVSFVKTPSTTTQLVLSKGGVFLVANSDGNGSDGVNSLSIASADTNPIVAEWLYAQ